MPTTVTRTHAVAKRALPRVGTFLGSDAGGIERLLRQRIDSFRQVEVELGEAAFTVGRENQAHFVVANINVGMVFLVLGYFRDSIDKIDRLNNFGSVSFRLCKAENLVWHEKDRRKER